jgi:hypothetical protein
VLWVIEGDEVEVKEAEYVVVIEAVVEKVTV